ncbi:MAG: type IV secretory system conjugative DNA transfer family protein [Clostridia bacterium]|nr:type IV secretory system conjugative DNA transfer family protein [Clostridia bacterium]
MKYLDKLLKVLKTDRNTFFTYIFTLMTIYLAIDRIVEVLFLIFTGIGVSYWGPITYTLALACPVLAFLFSGSSKYASSGKMKLTIIYMYAIALYIIAMSMFTQWLNAGLWVAFLSLPNYLEIVTKYTDLIKPAFQAIALYIPLTTFFSVFWWCYAKIADTRTIKESIWDYTGIDLSKKTTISGAYSFENVIAADKETGKAVKIFDNRRADPMLVCGPSGMGKTALLLEPMMARDMEKKYFFKEAAKEVGFTALKTGLATLNCPYTNEYLNENFTLNMIEPIEGKEKLYKAYLSKLIYAESPKIIYKDLGITFLTPDYESSDRMIDVAQNFNLKVNIVDPSNPDSIGINPFSYGSDGEIAGVISTILTSMYSTSRPAEDETYFQNSSAQAVENLAILLLEMYPRLNNGLLPNLEDMLDMLNDFDLVVDMCKKMEADPELALKHKLQLGYFKKHFYTDAVMRHDTEKYVHTAITQLDGLLRIPGLKNVLCNRSNNINFDTALENGEVTIVCTRRGDLGAKLQKAFGEFFLLSMQRSVIKRPGTESSRIPHLLYIDDSAEFLSASTLSMFTVYRKYKVGTIATVQNLEQLNVTSTSRRTVLSNCTAKIVFGNLTPEENEFWSQEFGDKREWLYSQDMSIKGEGSGDQFWGGEGSAKNVSYGDYKGVKWGWKKNFELGKIQALKFKNIAFKYKDDKGKSFVGVAILDFMQSKYKEPHKSKQFDFRKYQTGIVGEEVKRIPKTKFKPQKVDFDDFEGESDVEPIQNDNEGISGLWNNEDAIIYDIKKKQ